MLSNWLPTVWSIYHRQPPLRLNRHFNCHLRPNLGACLNIIRCRFLFSRRSFYYIDHFNAHRQRGDKSVRLLIPFASIHTPTSCRVFALGLPCKDDKEGEHSSLSLSTGAKAGIGAGVGLAFILSVFLLAWFILRHRKHKKEKAADQARISSHPMAIDPKHASSSTATTMMPGSPIMSTQGAYFQQQQQQPMLGYPSPHQPGMYPPMQGYVQPHGFSPAFGYVQPGGHDSIQSQYGYPIQPGMMYPGVYNPYSTSTSPPPPFHTGPEQKPVEIDGGVVIAAPEPRRVESGAVEMGGSEGGGTNTGTESAYQSGGGAPSSTTRS